MMFCCRNCPADCCSLKIRIPWSRACGSPCAYPGSAAIADGLTLSSSSEPGGRCASFRLQITSFWISCRPSCRPNGQDVGRHDGRHENPENAYTLWIFLFDRVMLANLAIEKNDFSRASSLYGHMNTFSASLPKKNFISGGRQRKVRKHVSWLGEFKGNR